MRSEIRKFELPVADAGMLMVTSRVWNGFTGLVCGLALAGGVVPLWLSNGTSLAAQTALLVTIGLAAAATTGLRCLLPGGLLRNGAALFCLSAGTLAVPSLLQGIWRLLSASEFDPTGSLRAQTVLLTVIACGSLGVPLTSAMELTRGTASGVGMSLGILLAAVLLCPSSGAQGCRLIASTAALGAFLTVLMQARIRCQEPVPRDQHDAKSQKKSFLTPFLMCIGALIIVGQRLSRQIVPDSMTFSMVEWAVIVGGIALGQRWTHTNPRTAIAVAALLAACASWVSFALFPVYAHAALAANSYVSHVALLWTIRLALTIPMLCPLAWSAGLLFRRPMHIVALVAGGVAAMWLIPVCGVWWLTVILNSTLIAAIAVAFRPRVHSDGLHATAQLERDLGRAKARKRLGPAPVAGRRDGLAIFGWQGRLRIGIFLCVLFPLVAPFWICYQPAIAAKMLFDSGVFLAYRGSTPWHLLPVMDDRRFAVMIEGDRSTLTAWKSHGTQFLVRDDGIPRGTLAANSELAPRYVPDVLPSFLPLVLHEQPRRVLLLGMRAGEPLAVTAEFPVQRVLCIEPDRGVVRMARRIGSGGEGETNPTRERGNERVSLARRVGVLDDDRVETRVCDPNMALRTLRERFDVIVASPDQAALSQAAASFTVESFRAAARCLEHDGLFALRFQHVDLSLRSLRILAKTMSAAFREVAAVEMAAGEMLFFGTNSERGFAREGWLGRLQSPQSRRILASLGWDWSTPLRLGMQDADAIAQLANAGGAEVNVAATSTWPFRLPTDVMRWDNKLKAIRAELAKRERFLTAWAGDDAGDPDVATRLSEWELSRRILARHVDEYWAYRKSVKEHLTQSPRGLIQQVGLAQTESGLHPDDDRRVRYFRTLGEVAKIPHPTEADLDKVRGFETPFDPLITPFVHQEVIELLSRCESRDGANELRHRLAAIYFSTVADRSVRNVADAIMFVNSTPEAIPDQAERFDQLNSLLQMLLNRWGARGEFQPTSSRVMLNDIEGSIAAAEASFRTMEQLSESGVVGSAEWNARRQFLERRLVRPLRTYRGEVLKHFVRTERTRDAAAATNDASASIESGNESPSSSE